MPASSRLVRSGPWLILATLVNSAYLWAVSSAGLFYIANVLGHLVLAVALMALWGQLGRGMLRETRRRTPALLGISLFLLAAGTGLALIVVGNFRPNRPLLFTHIAACVGASGVALWWLRRQAVFHDRPALFPLSMGILVLAVAVPMSRPLWPHAKDDVITNLPLPPADMGEYYKVERQRQINVGGYRAGDTTGDIGGYKDANWQLRHFYEPTMTW